MLSTPESTAQSASIRWIGGALAFLLLCGTALVGGAQKPKVAHAGYWHAGTKAPLVDVIAYPKDCQRSGESRWRYPGESDDQLDQPFALEAYPQPPFSIERQDGAAQPKRSAVIAFAHYRPQAPRAPPLA